MWAQRLMAQSIAGMPQSLEESKNERLWFKCNLKLCGLWFNHREYGRMSKILRELRA